VPRELVDALAPRVGAVWNMYGPTETTVWSSTELVTSAQNITLGHPIANTSLLVVTEDLRPVVDGETGELLIGGDGLALGYLKREELSAQKFIPDTVSNIEGARLYRTGDEVLQCADGTLEFLGRLDHQVKLNGFRIELGEIESTIARIEDVRQAVVILREDAPGDKRLVAYYTGKQDLDTNEVLATLRTGLPEYMVPSAIVWMAEFPQTPNAKLDRKALPAPARKRPQLAQDYIAPFSESEKQMAALWQEMLRIDQIGIDDSFFDLGGNSIAVFRMISAYRSRYQREIPPVKVFQYPTIAQLCDYLARSEDGESAVADALSRTSHRRGRGKQDPESGESIAVVGMVGRFPGADNLDQLWRNLRESRESISFFTPEELSPGIDDKYRTASDYVRARGIIEGVDLFDPAFFGISPLEARVMDPQQRLFLEQAYNALENAGYDPSRYRGFIGVYAGIGDNHYYTTNLLTHPDLLARAGKLAIEYGNQKDYIALRTAYLLDLRGPAISLNTACSTTLLAVDMAYRGLLDYECDMALAGGIDITIPHKSGFLYTEGGTFARDGHCRPFDADATGTMFCDGSGVVVLKRLSDALKDGDRIYAVLHGTGKNNNGSRPASFLAPSAEGQAEAVAMAQANAGIDVEQIGYIEAHGTGTPVGDPIEIEALNSVFSQKTEKRQYCYIGSIKGNVGHPTNAAGVAGFIKAAMVLDREEIPPTLHYKTPNPRINFAESPFIVADKLVPYKRGTQPRYTAVSSFGFGGTNVHAILGEAPLPTPGSESRPMQLFPISARTAGSLDALSASLADHFQSASESEFADTAFTLQTGRKQLAMRRIVVASSPAEAARLLQQPDPRRVASKRCERRDPPIVFLFGGQGTQYVNMGQNLYADEPLFRAVVDDCCEILKPHLGRDLREMLYPRPDDEETAAVSLQDTFYTQPSLFVIEYALARLWQSLGIQPAVMAGHSIGEFVAATLADVWNLEDVLRIVAQRGRLMQSLPRGTMMSVRASAESIAKRLPPDVQIASNNAPSLCVISGPDESVQAVRAQFEAENIVCRPLHTSHAFHSTMMDPMVEPLRAEIAKVQLRPPSRPVVSTVTGKMMTEAEATGADYWAHQARATVAFSDATLTLKEQGHRLFLECGPRSTLCA
ncbi:MAG TPA: beta-ketoacyl synthase N-terminal-like domain-containing protein, partial [Terracidiphilus sp.]|nr:beta-ketoacyl synthase N-terminal-like domain-containing protein [Terracidiphilus sp.]